MQQKSRSAKRSQTSDRHSQSLARFDICLIVAAMMIEITGPKHYRIMWWLQYLGLISAARGPPAGNLCTSVSPAERFCAPHTSRVCCVSLVSISYSYPAPRPAHNVHFLFHSTEKKTPYWNTFVNSNYPANRLWIIQILISQGFLNFSSKIEI